MFTHVPRLDYRSKRQPHNVNSLWKLDLNFVKLQSSKLSKCSDVFDHLATSLVLTEDLLLTIDDKGLQKKKSA